MLESYKRCLINVIVTQNANVVQCHHPNTVIDSQNNKLYVKKCKLCEKQQQYIGKTVYVTPKRIRVHKLNGKIKGVVKNKDVYISGMHHFTV